LRREEEYLSNVASAILMVDNVSLLVNLEVNRKRSINPLSRLPSANNLGINWV
jgi:hypothetical protein